MCIRDRAKAEADRKRQEDAAAAAEAERVNQLEPLGLGPSQEMYVQGLEQVGESMTAKMDRLIARARQGPPGAGELGPGVARRVAHWQGQEGLHCC
eukprot:15463791-Alexandrium_andersonii.AAC.1